MKSIRIFGIVLTVVISLFLLLSCGQKPITLGSLNKIIVIVDSTLWQEVGPDLEAALAREIRTPQPEPVFQLVPRAPKDLGGLTRYTNLILLSTLDAKDDTKEMLEKILPPGSEIRHKVEQDSSFLFKSPDAWAKGQLLVVIAAKDKETLKQRLQTDKDVIFTVFDEYSNEKLASSMFKRYEQAEISEKLMQEHGWNVRVQHDYVLAIDSLDARFVWLRRMNPQRWLFVYWEPVDDPSILTKEWMLETRNRLTNDFYEGDFVLQDDEFKVSENEVDFANKYALRLDGIWQNEKHSIGGPFRSYAFYNESDQRIYMLDCAVFAPGSRKWSYMRQLDVIAHTFKTKDQLGEK